MLQTKDGLLHLDIDQYGNVILNDTFIIDRSDWHKLVLTVEQLMCHIKVKCEKCAGKGCQNCNDSGVIRNPNLCILCNGLGMPDCPKCRGRGIIDEINSNASTVIIDRDREPFNGADTNRDSGETA